MILRWACWTRLNYDTLLSFFLFIYLFIYLFWHMEASRLGVNESCRHWPTPQPQQCWILNPLSKARDPTGNLLVPSQVCYHWAMTGTPRLQISYPLCGSWFHTVQLSNLALCCSGQSWIRTTQGFIWDLDNGLPLRSVVKAVAMLLWVSHTCQGKPKAHVVHT